MVEVELLNGPRGDPHREDPEVSDVLGDLAKICPTPCHLDVGPHQPIFYPDSYPTYVHA